MFEYNLIVVKLCFTIVIYNCKQLIESVRTRMKRFLAFQGADVDDVRGDDDRKDDDVRNDDADVGGQLHFYVRRYFRKLSFKTIS